MASLRLSTVAPLLLALVASVPALAQQPCDRACMKGVVDSYLAALVTHDPAKAPLATIYRHTENDVVQPRGEGLWKSVTALGAMQRQYYDEVTQNAVFYGTLVENGPLAVTAVRLHIVNRQITEAEWWVGREADKGVDGVDGNTLWDAEYLTNGNPPLVRTVPAAERSTREELEYITNSYWDYVVDRNPNIVAAHPGCYREENGQKTVGNPLPPERLNDGGLDGLSDCRSGSNGFNVQNVTARRWHVIDVEQQVVVASALFIREPGHAKRRNHFCDVFYIDGGKLRGLYTAMYYVPPTRAVPNWAPYPGNFPLADSFGPTK
jgi:hypothetical protein